MTTEVEVGGADHHEVQRSFQLSFFKDVKSLVIMIEDSGNPFLEESEVLIVLDTKEIAVAAAVTILRQIEAVGKEQCNQFITERLLNRIKSLYDLIKRNKVSLFTFSPPKEFCKTSQQLSSMRSDCALFARLYISCHGDLDEFFKHENQGCPPSLSHLGKLRLPKKKYDLTECVEANTTRRTEVPSAFDATIIGGSFQVCRAIILSICINTAPSC